MERRTISVKNAPLMFLSKKVIKNHFSQFGEITSLTISVKTKSCFVTFFTATQAEDAKLNGTTWKGKRLDLTWEENIMDKVIDEELNWGIEEVKEPKEKSKKLSNFKFEFKSDQRRSPTIELKKIKTEEDETKTDTMKIDENLIDKIAMNSSEQLAILEERDKLIRLKSNKTINHKKDFVVKGTCPDMCPEKERIMRESRGIVAPYETSEDSTINHKLFVKEYTRSSADQEEPLPHELRPEPVLTMTMEYLITQIMCKIENKDENLGNWFDFCWGRLRAIRKDIIQQQLCDLNTVRIVEQCARLHIVCFDRLWGLPSTVFDEKINSETLMNCLQSLTHMYEDLRKQNITCPNEPEFKGYLVLLKLSSGYLLSEYQQFSDKLQNSPEVKDAVQIHTAYSNNMYSAFFKLLKKTSYLNACLMQRFFGHLRTNALDIIVKAHCPPNKMCKLTLDYIMECLKFDLQDDCVTFCESFGFDYTKGLFVVSRNNFYFPEQLFNVLTPSDLVIKKRVLVSQAVCGKDPLPIYIEHEVHSSFTIDNNLKEEALDASDQEEKMLRDIVERKLLRKRLSQDNKPAVRLPAVSITKSSESNENIYKDVMVISDKDDGDDDYDDDIDGGDDINESMGNNSEPREEPDESLDEEIDEMSTEMEECDESEEESDQSTDFSDVMSETVHEKSFHNQNENSPLASVDSSTYSSFKFSQLKSEMTHQPPVPPLTIKTPSPVHFTATFKKPLTPATPLTKKSPTPPSASTKKPNFFIPILNSPSPVSVNPVKTPSPKTVKTEHFKFTSKEKLENEESMIMMKLKKKLSEKMKKMTARKFLRIWKLKVEKIKRLRENIHIDHVNISLKDHLDLWGITNHNVLPKISERLDKRKKTGLLIAAILHTNIVDQIDKEMQKVSSYIADILGKNAVLSAHNYGNVAQPHPVYWKLIFALPGELAGGSTFPKKLRMWCKAAFYPESDSTVGDVFYRNSNSGVPVFSSIDIIEGTDDISKKCNNLSALIIVRAEGWETNAETLDRLNKILSVTIGKIPVAIMTVGSSSHVVKLPVKKPNITHLYQDNWNKTENIIKAIGSLAKNTCLYNLKVQPLGSAVEIIGEKLLDALHEDKFSNEGLDILLTNPNNIIDFYNELIDKIEIEIKDCCLFNLYGTACELRSHIKQSYNSDNFFPQHYNDPNFKSILANHMKSLKLKHIKWTFKNSLDFLAVFKEYCHTLKCHHILSKLMRLINPPDVDSGVDLTKYLEEISWLPIVELLIKQTIKKELCDFIVVYRYHKVQEIIDSHWWLSSDIVIKTNQSFLPES